LVVAEEAILTWRGEGAILVDVLAVAVVPRANEVLEEDEEMTVIYCYYYKEPDHTKYQCLLLKGKLARGAHIFVTLLDDKQLRRQFEQFQMFQQ